MGRTGVWICRWVLEAWQRVHSLVHLATSDLIRGQTKQLATRDCEPRTPGWARLCNLQKAGRLKVLGRKGLEADCETSHHSSGASGHGFTSWREREVELEARMARSSEQLSCAAARAWASRPTVVEYSTGARDSVSATTFLTPDQKSRRVRNSANAERCLCCLRDQGSERRENA